MVSAVTCIRLKISGCGSLLQNHYFDREVFSPGEQVILCRHAG